MKKIILILLSVFIIALCASSSFASSDVDNTTTNEITQVNQDIFVSVDIGNDLDFNCNETVNIPLASEGSFDDLQGEVDNTSAGSVLKLNKDYNGTANAKIIVNKDLTIDGQGHTIDCLEKNNCIGFYSTRGTIILKNLIIKNGRGENGGGICSLGSSKYILENCTLSNNYASNNGGAICSENDVSVSKSIFSKNMADQFGGAIYSKDRTVYVDNSTFYKNNVCTWHGGAIYAKNININSNQTKSECFNSFFIENIVASTGCGGAMDISEDVIAINTLFSGNTAGVAGGAIRGSDKRSSFSNCKFINNKASKNDGGAIKCEGDVIVDNSTFINNWAYSDGGAIFAGHMIIKQTPSYFINNYASTFRGGAIYTNKFMEDVKYATFIGNKAAQDSWITRDGGAIYINEENHVTFSNCVFVNNKCSDEGGAIYLDSSKSHLTLKENIFMGNSASEGQAVYNCGEYDSITNNFWGGKNPSSDNDILIEWHSFPVPNTHHSDSNPLKAVLAIDPTYGNKIALVSLNFYNSNGNLFKGEIFDLYAVNFNITPDVKIKYIEHYLNGIDLKMIPEIGNKYTIVANVYGYTLTKTLDLTQINITAPEITTTYDVPAEFKIHLDGDKNLIANQKITVTLNSTDYTVVSDENGDASLYFNNYAMYPGTYEILINVANHYYTQSALTILPNITIVAPGISSYYGGSREFKIHLEGDKRFTANQKVTVSMFNLHYNICTDENGDVSLCLDQPGYAGIYTLSINVLNINAKSQFEVKSTIKAENIVITYGDHTPFAATLLNSKGEYLPNYAVVQYAIDNGAFTFINVRGNEGQALFNIAYLYPSYHSIVIYNIETRELREFGINILAQLDANTNTINVENQLADMVNQNMNNANKIALSAPNHSMGSEIHQDVNDVNSNPNEVNKVVDTPSANTEIGLLIALIIALGCGGLIIKRKMI